MAFKNENINEMSRERMLFLYCGKKKYFKIKIGFIETGKLTIHSPELSAEK